MTALERLARLEELRLNLTKLVEERRHYVGATDYAKESYALETIYNALPGLIAALREAVTALEKIREFKAWPSSSSLSQSALATIEALLKP